jgi:regulator of cell morphogenesis and NO signaling
MKNYNVNTSTIGEIVAQDYRAASVFKEAGIDFCCGGKKSIDETCSEQGIDPVELIEKLEELDTTPNTSTHNFIEWEPGFLCDYIVNTHHKYVVKSLPDLVHYTDKIASVHGERHPELAEVADLFSQINRELLQHMKNEEEVLFPAIKEVLSSGSGKAKATIISEIVRLSGEHEFAGGAMDKINVITHHYLVPYDGCNTYHLTFKLLQQFEDDLHTHVHLENNILFPKALKSANHII